MPSRQERRRAERDAAKRAPARAGAAGAEGGGGGAAGAGEAGGGEGGAGAAGATAALANLGVDPGGDWTTQDEDYRVLVRSLGPRVVQQRAIAGNREAQYSLGRVLVAGAGAGDAGGSGAAGRPPKGLVGLAL